MNNLISRWEELIHEKGVNAVMSAIYFGIDVDIQEGPNENRTIITQNNKLFPYRKQGTVPGESLINLVSLIQLTKLENAYHKKAPPDQM